MTSIKPGTTVTLRRGKYKGATGTVETATETQAVVKVENGDLVVLALESVKTPDVATIDADQLADVLATFQRDNAGDASDTALLQELADVLGERLLGFSRASVSWTLAVDA